MRVDYQPCIPNSQYVTSVPKPWFRRIRHLIGPLFCIDIIRVSISIHPHRVFMAYRLIVSSSTTLFGYRSKAPVYRYILRKAETTLSSRSFQMSSYSSRCLLAYFVWAKTPPCSAWGSSSGGRWVEGVSPSLIVHICFERVCYGSS